MSIQSNPRQRRDLVKKKLEEQHFAPCKHALSQDLEVLFAELPGQQTCPTCLLKAIVRTLRIVQKYIEKRGGTYLSRAGADGTQHKWLIDHWNRASVNGFRVVGLLTSFNEGWKGKIAGRMEARRLIGVWESERRKAEGFFDVGGVEEVRDGPLEKEDGNHDPVVDGTAPKVEEQEQQVTTSRQAVR